MKIGVIGGGLAGVSVASALAQRNKSSIFLIERESQLCQRASGNPAGVIMPVLTAEPTPISHFSFAAFQYAKDYYPSLSLDLFRKTGVFQFAFNDQKEKRFQKAKRARVFSSKQCTFLSATEVNRLLRLDIDLNAVHFPEAGWSCAKEISEALLLEYANQIYTLCSTNVVGITKLDNRFRIQMTNQDFEVDHLVLANAYEALKLGLPLDLPLRTIRGQCIEIERASSLPFLEAVLCFDHYISPSSHSDRLSIGGTYDRKNQDEEIRYKDTEELLEKTSGRLDFLNKNRLKVLSQRAATRTTTPDHLPICGELEHGITVMLGLGSRGLTFSPLCAEFIAKNFFKEPMTASQQALARMLSPQRFRPQPSLQTFAVGN